MSLLTSVDVLAQESPMGSGYQSPQQRDVFQTVPGQNDQESVLDATNTMD